MWCWCTEEAREADSSKAENRLSPFGSLIPQAASRERIASETKYQRSTGIDMIASTPKLVTLHKIVAGFADSVSITVSNGSPSFSHSCPNKGPFVLGYIVGEAPLSTCSLLTTYLGELVREAHQICSEKLYI